MTSFLRRLAGLATIVVIGLALAACNNDGRLVLHTDGDAHEFTVEVVDTQETRAQGLMNRMDLAPNAGMLFDFLEERPVSFWMMNTFIPLDMIFIGADGIVRNIHVNARPHDRTSIPSNAPVQYVLEIPGGRSVELGLKPGDRVEHARIKTQN